MKLLSFILACWITSYCFAAPSCDFTPTFYGTLLELAATNNAPGQLTLQPYFYGGICRGYYNNNWNLIHDPFGVITPQLFVYLGLTKHVQISAYVEEQTIWYKGRSASAIGDSYFGVGTQFLWDQKNTPIPNLRFDAFAIFPTGKYKNLGLEFNGNNGTGFGSYGAIFALIFNKIFYPNPCHPINISVDTGYFYLGKTNIQGVNYYGGGPDTHGTVNPAGKAFAFFAFEYYISSHLNFALDLQYTHTFPVSFKGVVGKLPGDIPAVIFTGSTDQIAICPALEIGFTPSVAMFIGGYFTIGRNTAADVTGVISFIASF